MSAVGALIAAIPIALLIHGVLREMRRRSEEEQATFLREYPGLAEELCRERFANSKLS